MANEPSDLDPTIDAHGTPGDDDRTISVPEAGGVGDAAGDLPREIGGYRIFGRLGEGGMGVVYEAEQPSPRRRVALKVIRGSEYRDELHLRMFAREAATLGRLQHPGIAGIYASGHTPDGRHYFAMELVPGTTLGTWLASRPAVPDRAEIALRLELFRQICDAVHYAHQRGVIHCDLKASNVIVTDVAPDTGSTVTLPPRTKVLDFGLARLTESDREASAVTEVGVIKGTLAYMAPEQARGDTTEVDVRTDVYALGVVLYELLTGVRPYSVDTGSLLAAVKVICEQAPRPLAEAWTASTKLDPDLATIVTTALAKDPDGRFASAAALGDDVGRFLGSQPILARPPSTMYQIRKLVSRRKPIFATAGAALALLVVASAGIAGLYVRSERNLARAVTAEQSARREAETAQRTSDFLVTLFDRADPERNRGQTVTAREVVDEGAHQLESELADEPLMKARLLATIGQVYTSLAVYDEARKLIEESLTLRQEHLAPGDPAIARSEHLLGSVLAATGDRDSARAAYDRAIAMYAALGPSGRDGLIASNKDLAWLLGQGGELEDAMKAIHRALAVEAERDPPDPKRLLGLQSTLATILTNRGDADSSVVVLEDALATSRRINGDENTMTASLLTNLGVAQGLAGHPERSTAAYLEALAIYQKIYGDNHPLVARALGNVGVNYAELGQFDQARPYMEKSRAALIAVHGPDSPMVAKASMNLGLLKLQSGDAAGAVVDLQRAVELHEKAAPDGRSISLSYSLYHLATARAELHQYKEARRLMERVVAIDQQIYGEGASDVADDFESLAEIERAAGDTIAAARSEEKMREIRTQLAAAAKPDSVSGVSEGQRPQ